MCTYNVDLEIEKLWSTPTSTAPDDYTTLSEERSITKTVTRQCFDIAIVDDNEREHSEKLLVVGSIVSGDFFFNPFETEVWIGDESKEQSVHVALNPHDLFVAIFPSYSNWATRYTNIQLY